jgi:hypothetical protein
MAVTKNAAQTLSKKLVDFRKRLDQEEQLALDVLLTSFTSQISAGPDGAGLLRVQGGTELLLDARRAIGEELGDTTAAITPTITTVTITTTLASHPVITCASIADVIVPVGSESLNPDC